MDSRDTMPDMAEALRYHGGNINAARRVFPEAPIPWIDLSTGINPVPYPIGNLAPDLWSRLPEPAAFAALEATAANAYGACAWADVVAAPGTQAIIQWLPRIVEAQRVGILGPTYGEHEKAWRAAGAQIVSAATLSDLESCDVAVVVNPNNPDGRLLTPDALARTAASLTAHGGLLVVDEAFMDVVPPGMSLVPALPGGTIVLRSVGKAYGLAGLRLGFAVSNADLAARLRAALGPWAVSGPAAEIGRRALGDAGWLSAAIDRLTGEAERLDRLLASAGFTPIGGTPLFRLVRCPDAARSFGNLAAAGILTRPFFDSPGVLRFGIPHGESAWARLEAALRTSRQFLHR